ncbi:hypothetical protein FBY39_1946 [Microbacterium sp. SLBN-146]|nr:hypothetical protein FBY39_1946 [Microbacterium sp. SLBN-146]
MGSRTRGRNEITARRGPASSPPRPGLRSSFARPQRSHDDMVPVRPSALTAKSSPIAIVRQDCSARRCRSASFSHVAMAYFSSVVDSGLGHSLGGAETRRSPWMGASDSRPWSRMSHPPSRGRGDSTVTTRWSASTPPTGPGQPPLRLEGRSDRDLPVPKARPQSRRRYLDDMQLQHDPEPSSVTSISKWKRVLASLAIIPDPTVPVARDLRTDLSPLELANVIRQQFYKDRNYLRLRRRRWIIGAIAIRLLALGLSGAATILLGLSNLSGAAAWGFALSALVTSITALEPFFNFRSRWVSADEALARWHSAEEALTLYVATRAEDELSTPEVVAFDGMRQDEWSRFTQDWLADRRSAGPGPHS